MSFDDVLADYLETGDEALLRGLDAADADEARSLRAALDEEAAWEEPGDDLWTRIRAEVADTPQVPAAASVRAAEPRSTPTGTLPPAAPATITDLGAARARRRPHPLAAGLLGAAAAAVVAVAITLAPGGGGSGDPFALAATDLAPGATGSGRARSTPSGIEIVLEIEGLPRAPSGSFYEAWVKGDKGLVPIGTFHTAGRVVLWSGVEPRDYPQLTVTIEPEDGNPASSGRRIMTGQLRTP